MIYRVYEAADGKAEAMEARFKNEVVKRLPSRDVESLGVFEEPFDAARLTYLARFKSENHRSKAWAAFGADPQWRAVKAATEVDGPLLKQQAVAVLSPALASLLLS